MKRICVFSDSHGYADHMLAAVRLHRPDLVIHLGDGEGDVLYLRAAFPDLAVENVRGNCDRRSDAPEVLRMTVAGRRIFAVHGHRYSVKYDPHCTRLLYAAMEDGADIVLFGHTHAAYLDEVDGISVMNPGSVGDTYRPTYGLITIEDGRVTTGIYDA